jgi:hypothetical protein
MLPCPYCRASGRPSTKREHFLPERFGHDHPFVLESGVVCDGCNGWAARRIDPSLFEAHGFQAFLLFVERVIGKSKAGRLEGRGVTLDPVAGTARYTNHGWRPKQERASGESKARAMREASLRAKQQRTTAEFKARALRKVALGAVAWNRGVVVACDPRLDDAAQYMREGGEFRPYAHAVGRWIDDEVHIAFEVIGTADTTLRVGIQVSCETWWVLLVGQESELAQIDAPLVRVVRAPVELAGPGCEWASLIMSDGAVEIRRTPAPLTEIMLQPGGRELFETFPLVQTFRTECPRWRPEPAQPPR